MARDRARGVPEPEAGELAGLRVHEGGPDDSGGGRCRTAAAPTRDTAFVTRIPRAMPRLRYVLFRAHDPRLLGKVTLALAALPNVRMTVDRSGWTVTDEGTGHVVTMTLAEGPLIAADIRALAANHWSDDPEGRAMIAATDARFELRYGDDDTAINPMLLVQDAVEHATDGFGYDLAFNRIVIAAEGESLVTDEGPEQRAENERLMDETLAMSNEELDRELTAAGADPEAMRKEGVAFVEALFEQRALVGVIEEALERADQVAREPREMLLERLAEARSVAVLGGAISSVLRTRALASLSDGEVQTLADEVAKWGARGKA